MENVSPELVAEFVEIMLEDGGIEIYDTIAGSKIKVHRTVNVTLGSRNKSYINHVKKF